MPTEPIRVWAVSLISLSCLFGCAGEAGTDPVVWSGDDDSGESGADDGGYPSFPTPSDDASAPPPENEAGNPSSGSSSGYGSSSGSSSGGYVVDSGGGKGKGGNQPSQGCINPACTTDGNECGCTATGSTGNVVALGCLEGGVCGCFDDTKTLQAGVFFDNGACGSAASAAQAFVQYCQCN
jgi:hypothetical protein